MIETNNTYTEGYKIVKDFLNANISDPRNRFKKDWVHASPPNVTANGFDGYPFMVVSLNVSQQNQSVDFKSFEDYFRLQITIYSKESTDVDNMSNELLQKINDKTLATNLNQLKAKVVSSSEINYTMVNAVKIYSRIFILSGKIRMQQ